MSCERDTSCSQRTVPVTALGSRTGTCYQCPSLTHSFPSHSVADTFPSGSISSSADVSQGLGAILCLLRTSLGSGACAGLCAGAGLGSMLCSAGAGCSLPLHPCCSASIFSGCLIFVGCGDGGFRGVNESWPGTCLGVSVDPGHGILSLEWWLLGSGPVLLSAGEGTRAGWCLLGRGTRRCLPEMFGSGSLSLAAGRVHSAFWCSHPWQCWVAVAWRETEA